MRHALLAASYLAALATSAHAQRSTVDARAPAPPLRPADVFALEYADAPAISPDGQAVVYVRTGFNVLTDGTDRRLWSVDRATGAHRKLTPHEANESGPTWSPDGDRLAYVVATEDAGSEVYVHWAATGQSARLSSLPHAPRGLRWSPDGTRLAFSMRVDAEEPDADFALAMPPAPEGATWAETPRVTTRLRHEADGRGRLAPGFDHLFVLPAAGGTARQLTGGPHDHGPDFAWVDDARIAFSANRRPDAAHEFRDDDLYLLRLVDTAVIRLTSGYGPDGDVAASPDGTSVAFLGHDDRKRAYQRDRIRLLDLASGDVRELAPDWDRDPQDLRFAPDGRSLYAAYTEAGRTKLAAVDLATGAVTELLDDLGGTSLGRPYTSGAYALAGDGAIAYTRSRPHRPADLAVRAPGGEVTALTALNDDLLAYRTLGEVREVTYASAPAAADGEPLAVQGWVILPPGYDSTRRYPLIVENHGGPLLAYGPHFSAELQLMAAHDYAVFYPNPRGSTGYGEAFSDLLYRNYPGEDYDDVMAGVDHVIGLGIAHPDSLYVTGGSAGGIMTAWIVGKTDRFRAAAVAKPVVNWISKTLVADNYFGYANARYEGQPYENPLHYWSFSPLSLVAEVTTPTMVLVGTDDLRTPPSEAKQLYHALKLERVPTALVELPGASHGIAKHPSQLLHKVLYTLGWFERYRGGDGDATAAN